VGRVPGTAGRVTRTLLELRLPPLTGTVTAGPGVTGKPGTIKRSDPGSAIGPARQCGIPAAPPGLRLEYASMAWMTVEAAVGIVCGIVASSIVLIGFALDSVIEFFAAAVVVWQLRGTVSEERESQALRLIAVTFFALAVYLAIESVADLVSQHRPEQSTAGIVVTAAVLVVMPLLALAKRRTGQLLDNRALVADAVESAFCAFTSAAALAGIGLNGWLGWWWADPAAALVVAGLAAREGIEAWAQEDD